MGHAQEKSTSMISLLPLALVVDDEESIRQALGDVLKDDGYEVIYAGNGDEAVRQAEKHRPPVVFLDIWMPGKDGIETLEELKKVSAQSQVIMMSGHATIATAVDASRRGALDFIEKPLSIESVLLAAKRAIEAQRGTQGGDDTGSFATDDLTRPFPQPVLTHAGLLSRGLAGENLRQRTLKRSTILYGQGLHSGNKSGLVLEPLPRNSGIHFARIGDTRTVPAFIEHVESTGFATRLRLGSTSAGTIEHLMAALHAYRITNLLIKCNSEVPIADGSSLAFCDMIESVGINEQGGTWFEIAPQQPLVVKTNEREHIELHPSDSLKVTYRLNYPAPVGEQTFTYTYTGPESFKTEIAPARTFGFMKDIEMLQRAGLAAGGRLDNFILIGSDKIVNTELRFTDELCRHKILDAIGDTFLLGRPIRGHIVASMTGHSDNVELLNQLKPLAVL